MGNGGVGVWSALLVGSGVSGLYTIWVRVKDEEAMLKGEFGREWEEYHRRTARFIPGVVRCYSPMAKELWRPKLQAGRRRIE